MDHFAQHDAEPHQIPGVLRMTKWSDEVRWFDLLMTKRNPIRSTTLS